MFRPRCLFLLLLLLMHVPANAQIAAGALGVQRILFLYCQSPDGQEARRYEQLPELVDQAVRRNSQGKSWVVAQSLSGIKLSAPAAQLAQRAQGLSQLQSDALTGAEQQIDPRNFDRFVLLIPCREAQLGSQGTVGKSLLSFRSGPFWASTAWIFLPPGASHGDVVRVVLHELGHGFGFRHDNSRLDGVFKPYGDEDDLMGTGYEHYGGNWRWEAGWLDSRAQVDIRKAGQYRVPPKSVVRIQLHGDETYWLEEKDAEFWVHSLDPAPQGDACRLKDLTRSEPLIDMARGIRISIVSSDDQGSVLLLEALGDHSSYAEAP